MTHGTSLDSSTRNPRQCTAPSSGSSAPERLALEVPWPSSFHSRRAYKVNRIARRIHAAVAGIALSAGHIPGTGNLSDGQSRGKEARRYRGGENTADFGVSRNTIRLVEYTVLVRSFRGPRPIRSRLRGLTFPRPTHKQSKPPYRCILTWFFKSCLIDALCFMPPPRAATARAGDYGDTRFRPLRFLATT